MFPNTDCSILLRSGIYAFGDWGEYSQSQSFGGGSVAGFRLSGDNVAGICKMKHLAWIKLSNGEAGRITFRSDVVGRTSFGSNVQ